MVLGQTGSQMKPNAPFVLRGSKDFVERQKNVFDQLTTTKCSLQPEEVMEVERSSPSRPRRVATKHFRGKESIFKVPQDPATYMKTIPDFKKNPHKWTKYSLADVKDEDMSDSSNTRTALSFLSELKNRGSEDVMDVDDGQKKIVFKKVTSAAGSSDKTTTKSSFRSSKVVMPEYVVGEKIKKRKKNHALGNLKSAQLKLDHLFEDE